MARKPGNDPTRRLRADRLQKYARDVDRSTRDATAARPPEIGVSVGYADEEESSATTRATLPPPAAGSDALTPDAVPVLAVAPGDAAWFDLHLDAQLILSAADGRATVGQIADKLGLDPRRVLATLRLMIAQELVKLK